jgi:hypothetical protein
LGEVRGRQAAEDSLMSGGHCALGLQRFARDPGSVSPSNNHSGTRSCKVVVNYVRLVARQLARSSPGALRLTLRQHERFMQLLLLCRQSSRGLAPPSPSRIRWEPGFAGSLATSAVVNLVQVHDGP